MCRGPSGLEVHWQKVEAGSCLWVGVGPDRLVLEQLALLTVQWLTVEVLVGGGGGGAGSCLPLMVMVGGCAAPEGIVSLDVASVSGAL